MLPPADHTHGDPDGSGVRPTPRSPSAREGRYTLGAEIARGGIGVVYRATDYALSREVAVKVLQERHSPDSGAGRRFADEARITGQLQHPGIPPVHDLGVLPNGQPFLAMKLIKGETLDALVGERLRSGEERGRLVAVFEQVCHAVAYAHSHDVIHRDLKPANIMVGAFGEVQVMDWGLAKVLTAGPQPEDTDPEATGAGTEILSLRDSDGSFTQVGSILGTPAFMPPEQALGAVTRIDARSDVFGLGGILAVILTGSPPFAGRSAETTRIIAAQGKLDDCFARLDWSGSDPELVALCKRCLAADKSLRPADAGEVARAVAALRQAADERASRAELDRVKAEGEAAAADVRATEQRKRRRMQAVLGLAVFALLSLAGAFAWWQDRQAEQAKRKDAEYLAEKIRDEADKKTFIARAEAERAAAELRAREGVASAVALAARLGDAYQFSEARQALDQAGRLIPNDDPSRLRATLQTAADDLALVVRLDEIRLSRLKNGWLNETGLPDAYAAAFRDRGLDPKTVTVTDAVGQVSASPIRKQLLAALDDWAVYERDGNVRSWVAGVARRVDPGPWAYRLRSSSLSDEPGAIDQLTRDVDVNTTPPHLLALLFQYRAVPSAQAERVLVAAAARHPQDFWLQFEAGCYFAFKARRYSPAAAYLRAALALRPDHQYVLQWLTTSLIELKEFEGGSACQQEMARLRPTAPDPHIYLGFIATKQGELDRAAEALSTAIRIDPKNPSAHLGLAVVRRLKAKWPEAIDAGLTAVRLAPENSAVIGRAIQVVAADPDPERLATSVEQISAVLLQPKDDELSLNLRKFNNLMTWLRNSGSMTAGARVFQIAAERRPTNARVWLLLGMTLRSLPKRQDDAELTLKRVVKLEAEAKQPASMLAMMARYYLGKIYQTQNRLTEAFEEFRSVTTSNTVFRTQEYYLLAHQYRDRGRLDEVLEIFRQAANAAPADAALRFKYADCLRYRGRYAEAIAEYQKAIAVDPEMHEAYGCMALALYGQHDLDGAVVAFRKDIRRNNKAKLDRTQAEELVALRPELDSLVRGTSGPPTPGQARTLARLAVTDKRFADGANVYEAATQLVADPIAGRDYYGCYHAQCAALAGTGVDPKVTDPAARQRFRNLAITWLRAERIAWAKDLNSPTSATVANARRGLQFWFYDPRLAGVRDPAELAKLPDAERSEWAGFWEETRALLTHEVAPRPRPVQR